MLDSNLKSKKSQSYFLVPLIKRANITLKQRFTLAAILYRNRIKPATVSYLARTLKFTRPTIYRHLAVLLEKGYVENTGIGWHAIQHGKLIRKNKSNNWIKDICYYKISSSYYSPERLVIGSIDSILNSSCGKKHQNNSPNGWAKMLGCSRTEARRALAELVRIGMLKRSLDQSSGRYCYEPKQ